MPPRPLTLRGRLIAALLVFSAVGLAMFAGASELLLRHSLLSRADQQLHHFPLHRIAAAERPNPQRLPSEFRLTVLAPDGTPDREAVLSRRIDNAMVKAIARAFRWREMLENGTHATIAEIAAAEKINESYVGSRLAADAASAGHHRGVFVGLSPPFEAEL